ncbi:hypothetical protein HK098_007655 [Nowakowskiella sp. JEL0407]|nr:hypothetical protein HK098_007655 [Nowakowskiella sp. JEL0407]
MFVSVPPPILSCVLYYLSPDDLSAFRCASKSCYILERNHGPFYLCYMLASKFATIQPEQMVQLERGPLSNDHLSSQKKLFAYSCLMEAYALSCSIALGYTSQRRPLFLFADRVESKEKCGSFEFLKNTDFAENFLIAAPSGNEYVLIGAFIYNKHDHGRWCTITRATVFCSESTFKDLSEWRNVSVRSVAEWDYKEDETDNYQLENRGNFVYEISAVRDLTSHLGIENRWDLLKSYINSLINVDIFSCEFPDTSDQTEHQISPNIPQSAFSAIKEYFHDGDVEMNELINYFHSNFLKLNSETAEIISKKCAKMLRSAAASISRTRMLHLLEYLDFDYIEPSTSDEDAESSESDLNSDENDEKDYDLSAEEVKELELELGELLDESHGVNSDELQSVNPIPSGSFPSKFDFDELTIKAPRASYYEFLPNADEVIKRRIIVIDSQNHILGYGDEGFSEYGCEFLITSNFGCVFFSVLFAHDRVRSSISINAQIRPNFDFSATIHQLPQTLTEIFTIKPARVPENQRTAINLDSCNQLMSLLELGDWTPHVFVIFLCCVFAGGLVHRPGFEDFSREVLDMWDVSHPQSYSSSNKFLWFADWISSNIVNSKV